MFGLTSLRFSRGVTRFVGARAAPAPRRRVMANSIPKSGTHLLQRLVASLPGMAPGAGFLRTLDPRTACRVVRSNLDSARGQPAVCLNGHQVYEPRVETVLRDYGYRVVLMVRDPRDVVVSHAHWAANPKHGNAGNRNFYSRLENIEQRLLTSICGRPAGWREGEISDEEKWQLQYHGVHATVGERLGHYLPWLRSPIACVVRFEDLVGPRGGGTVDRQHAAIRRVARHLGVALSEAEAGGIADGLFSTDAHTFRRGLAGGWRESFQWYHTMAFKAVAGQVLIELGYEDGFDW